jgi:hypothetical protein
MNSPVTLPQLPKARECMKYVGNVPLRYYTADDMLAFAKATYNATLAATSGGAGDTVRKPIDLTGDTNWMPISMAALSFLKDAALVKSGLGKLSPHSLKGMWLTDDEAQAVAYLYGVAEAFYFDPAPYMVAPSPANSAGWEVLPLIEVPGLDPIQVFLRDEAKGAGRIVVQCYGSAWTAYWGAMGDKTVREFVTSMSPDYIATKLYNFCEETHEQQHNGLNYLTRIVQAIQSALPSPPGDGGSL